MSARALRCARLPMPAWLIAGLLGILTSAVPAAEPSPDSLNADLAAASTTLAELREQRFRQQADETLGDDAGKAHFYLGLSASSAELESLVLAVDELPAQTVTITPEDRAALHARGGLLPLAAVTLLEGAHRLNVDRTLRGEPPRHNEFAFEINAAGCSERELRLERSQPLAGLTLTLIEWKSGEQRQSPFERWAETLIGEAPRSNGYQPGKPDDPRWRRARHLLASCPASAGA